MRGVRIPVVTEPEPRAAHSGNRSPPYDFELCLLSQIQRGFVKRFEPLDERREHIEMQTGGVNVFFAYGCARKVATPWGDRTRPGCSMTVHIGQ
jgi:hypothetical protein